MGRVIHAAAATGEDPGLLWGESRFIFHLLRLLHDNAVATVAVGAVAVCHTMSVAAADAVVGESKRYGVFNSHVGLGCVGEPALEAFGRRATIRVGYARIRGPGNRAARVQVTPGNIERGACERDDGGERRLLL